MLFISQGWLCCWYHKAGYAVDIIRLVMLLISQGWLCCWYHKAGYAVDIIRLVMLFISQGWLCCWYHKAGYAVDITRLVMLFISQGWLCCWYHKAGYAVDIILTVQILPQPLGTGSNETWGCRFKCGTNSESNWMDAAEHSVHVHLFVQCTWVRMWCVCAWRVKLGWDRSRSKLHMKRLFYHTFSNIFKVTSTFCLL
jgi:hypothetical protein